MDEGEGDDDDEEDDGVRALVAVLPALEAALEAEAVAFEERLRAPEAQAAFARFLGRAKPA